MSNSTYDKLKFLAQVLLPALTTLVVAIFTIWSIPYGEAVGATLMALDTFLGAVLHLESKSYYKEVEDNE